MVVYDVLTEGKGDHKMAKKNVKRGSEITWQAGDDPSVHSFRMGKDGTTRDAGRHLSFIASMMSHGQDVHNVRISEPKGGDK